MRRIPTVDGAAMVLLSDRETEVLALVVAGYASKNIAWKLQISESTVKGHIKHMMESLKLRNRVHLVTWALDHPGAFERKPVAADHFVETGDMVA